MTLKEKLQRVIAQTLSVKPIEINVERAPSFTGADFASNIAFVLAAKEGKSPKSVGEKIIKTLDGETTLRSIVEKIEAAGNGFINITIAPALLLEYMNELLERKEGAPEDESNQCYMVEFAHPNTHKPFHIGHLRNITTGESIARLLESSGIRVARVNYQGDVGLHIAKALWGIQKRGLRDPRDKKKRAEYLGEAYVAGNLAYEQGGEAKKEIETINQDLYEKNDKALQDLYAKTRQWSLEYFDSLYKRLGTIFDRLYFESEVAGKGKEIAQKALAKGILIKSEGAVIYPGKEHGLHNRVFITSSGLPTYEAKELGLAVLQAAEFHPDKIIHVVGPEQKDYFRVLFKVLAELDSQFEEREIYLPYGWVSAKGGKMSSRRGNVILGEELLDGVKAEIIKRYKTEEGIAEDVALGAVKYSFLAVGISQDMVFDIEESIALEGNSGPYLQYTYARTQSVLTKAGREIGESVTSTFNEEERNVLRVLIHFPDAVCAAARDYSPNLLCNFLFELAQTYNTFYNRHRIIDSDNQEFRLGLSAAVGRVFKRGLFLLGIRAPKRM